MVMLLRDDAAYETILAEHLGAQGIRTARAAAYPGVEVGPRGIAAQWAAVFKMMSAQIPEIAHAPSLTTRVALFSCVSSLYALMA